MTTSFPPELGEPADASPSADEPLLRSPNDVLKRQDDGMSAAMALATEDGEDSTNGVADVAVNLAEANGDSENGVRIDEETEAMGDEVKEDEDYAAAADRVMQADDAFDTSHAPTPSAMHALGNRSAEDSDGDHLLRAMPSVEGNEGNHDEDDATAGGDTTATVLHDGDNRHSATVHSGDAASSEDPQQHVDAAHEVDAHGDNDRENEVLSDDVAPLSHADAQEGVHHSLQDVGMPHHDTASSTPLADLLPSPPTLASTSSNPEASSSIPTSMSIASPGVTSALPPPGPVPSQPQPPQLTATSLPHGTQTQLMSNSVQTHAHAAAAEAAAVAVAAVNRQQFQSQPPPQATPQFGVDGGTSIDHYPHPQDHQPQETHQDQSDSQRPRKKRRTYNTEEERRKARILKNRRTAEESRQRRLKRMNDLEESVRQSKERETVLQQQLHQTKTEFSRVSASLRQIIDQKDAQLAEKDTEIQRLRIKLGIK